MDEGRDVGGGDGRMHVSVNDGMDGRGEGGGVGGRLGTGECMDESLIRTVDALITSTKSNRYIHCSNEADE